MKKVKDLLFSMQLTGMLLVVFGVVIAVATFIENDFGTRAAKVLVYNSKWFEFLLLLIAVNMLGTIIVRKMYRIEKLTIFVFHIAFIVIILGAGITRFFGFEGSMHIREGKSSNSMLSTTQYLTVEMEQDGKNFIAEKEYMAAPVRSNRLKMKIKLNDHHIVVKSKEFIPNAYETLVESPDGKTIMHLVLFDGVERQDLFIPKGEIREAAGLRFSLDSKEEADVKVFTSDTGNYFTSNNITGWYNMMRDTGGQIYPDTLVPFQKMMIYNIGDIKFVMDKLLPSAKVELKSAGKEARHYDAVLVDVDVDGIVKEAVLYHVPGNYGKRVKMKFDNLMLTLSYGAKTLYLPFELKLNDFILERYPGSESPSSFTSVVTLMDKERNINRETKIFMNNVLNHRGYRFFQSSYDKDEKGTILSVNHDFWGTTVTYLGYILLFIGMVLSLLNKNSRFAAMLRYKAAKTTLVALLFLLSFPLVNMAQSNTAKYTPPSVAHAEKFGQLLVQDNSGRIEPINTLASEVLRKIARKTSFNGMTPEQVLLGMMTDPEYWKTVPIIKVTHPKVKEIIGVSGKRVSFNQVVDFENERGYLLEKYVNEAYEKKPAERNKFDKDVMAVDERLNICYLIYIGKFMKIFPAADDPDNKWYTAAEAFHTFTGKDTTFIRHFMSVYGQSVKKASETGDWKDADFLLNGLKMFQETNGKNIIPPKSKIKLEIFYNKQNIFNKLEGFYGLFGFLLLLIHFVNLLIPKFKMRWIIIISTAIVIIAFLMHTAGLGIRWYISGHAPWSNAYESMVFIAWATVLAGIVFVRKSPISLTATALLASMILSVAHLNWLDPEITNLVPVLKSYWLVIHVAIITSSYGFLALGALLGFFSLLVMILMGKNNHQRLMDKVREMTAVNEVTLIAGLYLLTIGTFLGGVWANESWGRYWGWDPKETWALVTVVVYTFILHMRMIPGLKGIFAYNLASLIGYGSVIMTYFGVNYYLSGLHSYASGDPVPVPAFVYYTVAVILITGIVAYVKFRKFGELKEENPAA